MINQFADTLKNNNYGPLSIKTYIQRLTSLIDFVNKKNKFNIIDDNDIITAKNINLLIDAAKEYNNNLISVSNKLKTLTLIKSIIKNSNVKNYKIPHLNILEKDFEKIKTVRDDTINKNIKSPRYESVEFNNLLRMFFNKETQDKLTNIEKFILSLYLLNPPLRNNFYKILYFNNETDFNNADDFHVKIFKDKMIINKAYLKVTVPDNIEITLTPYQIKLLSDMNLKNKSYIINYYPVTFSGKIKQISKKAFSKDFGANDYRHMFISSLNINKLSNQQLKQIALKMNQTKIDTLLTYRKFKKEK
jgi:hypothetical protein